MKASVQYNDLVGTAAADVADCYFNSLQKFLEDTFSSFDGGRYSCRGCSAFIVSNNCVAIDFICLDKREDKFVRFQPKDHWTFEEFFSLFKRFEIVIGQDVDEVEIVTDEDDLTLYNDGDEQNA